MWQRFTERARRVVFFAQEEAARLGENYVGTEHLLLGLVRAHDSVAARILDRLGVPLGRIRSEIEQQVTRGHGNLGQDMQLTPRAKRVIDLAYEEARQLNNNYIGTEHLLLGLIREGSGLAWRVLTELGADLERTRRVVYDMQEDLEAEPDDAARPPAGAPDGVEPAFSQEAVHMLQFAQEEAARRNAACVGTEHLLLALIHDAGTVAARILGRCGVEAVRLRSRVERLAIGSRGGWPQSLPCTWHARRTVDYAYDAARHLRSDFIGAEHLLLALLREGDSRAAHALNGAGATWERVASEARRLQDQGRSTDERRAGYFLAQARAQVEQPGEPAVSTEHLLLSLIREDQGAAVQILQALGASVASMRAAMEQPAGPGPGGSEPPASKVTERPLTPRAQDAIDRGRAEARRLHSTDIGGEHLLLGLLIEGNGFGGQVLREAGVSLDHLEALIPAVQAATPEGGARAAIPEPEVRRPEGEGAGGHGPTIPRHHRFTERARRIIFFAQEEAARLGENYVGTEHLLLGLVRENDSVAARFLDRLGVPLGRIRSEIERQVTRGHGNLGQDMQMTPRARRGLDLAYEEARQLNHNTIGTEHLLLGLIREGDGLAARVLVKLGADLERARREVYAMQEGENQPAAVRTERQSEEAARWRPEEASLEKLERLSQPDQWAQMAPAGRRAAARAAAALARTLVAAEGGLSDFLSINDLTSGQARALLALAQTLKASGKGDRLAHREILPGKVLAMIFEKPSLRTRVTFETGMFQMGGHAVSLQPAEIQLGKRETVADAARNLERWVDGIMARTFSQQHVVELAQNAGVPVINGLTDREHPCQALADFLTIWEKKGRTEGLKLAYLGDGNNVAHSLLLLGAKLGTHVTLAGPEGYEPDDEIVRQAREAGEATGARIEVIHDPLEAVREADIVYTDVWASMGQEAEAEARAPRFAPFQLNAALLQQAKPDVIVMHDLPAHRGEEITDEVMDGPQSVIFDQAENRLHAQKALLAVLLG